jgi:processive 1,2-diacylglycerol beta-glucosyltransferase
MRKEVPGTAVLRDTFQAPGGERPRTSLQSALVLSGSIGKGHDSVAEACRVAFAGAELPVRVVDCMNMLGGPGSRAGSVLFRRVLSVPALYDAFHFGHLRTATWLPTVLQYAATHEILGDVRQQVVELADRYDAEPLIVSVFPTGVSAAAALKRERQSLKAVAICTDACAHRMWVAEGTDLYIVCSPLAATTVLRYAPDSPVVVVPPPVKPAFYSVPPKRTARDVLGIPVGATCVLLMAGGWGLAPLAETAEALGEAGYFVLAVAGLNGRLHARLRAVAERCWRVVPFGMTERVPELMAAADVVVTSSGQSCNEARVVGRSIVILDVVPGHGRENTLHELEQGAAIACSPDPESVASALRVILNEEQECPPWPVRSTQEWQKHFFGALAAVGFDARDPVRLPDT